MTKYRPVSRPIPPVDDIFKKYYLTYSNAGGKCVIEEFIEKVELMEQ